MAAVGWWLVVRIVKVVGGRIEQEEARLKRQEAEVEALRSQVGALGVEVARCHAERDFNHRQLVETKEALERAMNRMAKIEEQMP